MRKLTQAMVPGAAALALLAGAPGIAHAGTDSPAETRSVTRAGAVSDVPSCVTGRATLMVGVIVTITNNCATTERVNVRYSYNGKPFVPDKCHTIAPGGSVTTSEAVWSANRYEGLIPC